MESSLLIACDEAATASRQHSKIRGPWCLIVFVVGPEERYCTPLSQANGITEIQNAFHWVVVSLEEIDDTVYKGKAGV